MLMLVTSLAHIFFKHRKVVIKLISLDNILSIVLGLAMAAYMFDVVRLNFAAYPIRQGVMLCVSSAICLALPYITVRRAIRKINDEEMDAIMRHLAHIRKQKAKENLQDSVSGRE